MKAADLSWGEQCQNLLDILNRSEDSIPFRQPVNLLNVPDYLLLVDQPMDLKTVGKNLQAGHYATPSDFSNDVRLIFENSKNFKPNRNSVMYAMTDRLAVLFEEHFKNILNYKTQKIAAGCKSKLFLFK